MAKNISDDDELYKSLRQDAFELEDEAYKIRKKAYEAYMRQNHTSCHKLGKLADSIWDKAQRLHEAAAEAIFNINNANNNEFEIDLHGLHRSEAVTYVHRRLVELADAPQSLLVITGQGNHSRNGPILPAAIKDFCEKNGYICEDGRPGTFLVSRAGKDSGPSC